MADINTSFGPAGIGALASTTEAQVWSGPADWNIPLAMTVKSTATDTGNTPTTTLRPGLVMAMKTSDGLLYPYDPAQTDGREVAYCILMVGGTMLNAAGVAEDKTSMLMLIAGIVKASALVTGQATGILDATARRQLVNSGRYFFDDDWQGRPAFGGLMLREQLKIIDYTIVAADNGSLFTNTGASGAVNFTLPALTPGLCFEFLSMVAAQNLTVTSAEGDNIVWDGDLSCDSLSFQTGSHIAGGHLQFVCNAAGTKWYVRQLGPSGCTVTVAT